MTVGHCDGLTGVALSGEGIEGVGKKTLIGPSDGWDGWVMRRFDIAPAGHTPHHTHAWPHVNVVLSGAGVLRLDGGDEPLSEGSYAYVAAGQRHQFRAAPHSALSFICIVPAEGDV